MKKIVITGGAGFIGSHLVNFFYNKYKKSNIYVIDKLTYAGNLQNIKLLLNNPTIIPDHSNINNDIDKWLDIKSSSLGKLQHIASYLPKEEKKDGK